MVMGKPKETLAGSEKAGASLKRYRRRPVPREVLHRSRGRRFESAIGMPERSFGGLEWPRQNQKGLKEV